MRYKGKINELNHIIISDPSYDESVTCRYEKTNLKEKNWSIDIDIKPVEDKIENFTIKGTEFFLFLCKDKKLGELKENGTISYLRGIALDEVDIGIDTACVALGINEKAKEIVSSRDDWQPECSLKTLSDGIFGTVKEGKIGENVVFIWLSGYLCEDTDYSIDEIVDYIEHQLNIVELQKDISKSIIIKQQNTVEKMAELISKFKKITKENQKLLDFFKEDNRFLNIDFAGTYLAGIDVRNQERKLGNLEGPIEKSPYSELEERIIREYTELQKEFEKTEKEFENNIDI